MDSEMCQMRDYEVQGRCWFALKQFVALKEGVSVDPCSIWVWGRLVVVENLGLYPLPAPSLYGEWNASSTHDLERAEASRLLPSSGVLGFYQQHHNIGTSDSLKVVLTVVG